MGRTDLADIDNICIVNGRLELPEAPNSAARAGEAWMMDDINMEFPPEWATGSVNEYTLLAAAKARVQSSAPVPPEGPPPRDYWVELSDPKSGRKYYFNAATKERSWTRPARMWKLPVKMNPCSICGKDPGVGGVVYPTLDMKTACGGACTDELRTKLEAALVKKGKGMSHNHKERDLADKVFLQIKKAWWCRHAQHAHEKAQAQALAHAQAQARRICMQYARCHRCHRIALGPASGNGSDFIKMQITAAGVAPGSICKVQTPDNGFHFIKVSQPSPQKERRHAMPSLMSCANCAGSRFGKP